MGGFSGAWSTHWTTTDGQFKFQPVSNNEVHDAQGPIIAGRRVVQFGDGGSNKSLRRNGESVKNKRKRKTRKKKNYKKKLKIKKDKTKSFPPLFLEEKFRMQESTQVQQTWKALACHTFQGRTREVSSCSLGTSSPMY